MTPYLDELAYQSTRLEMYYVQPLCSPTRATIMTGRFTSHTGVGPNVIKPSAPYAVPKNETFLPELLKQAGYVVRLPPPALFRCPFTNPLVVSAQTHAVGKWVSADPSSLIRW